MTSQSTKTTESLWLRWHPFNLIIWFYGLFLRPRPGLTREQAEASFALFAALPATLISLALPPVACYFALDAFGGFGNKWVVMAVIVLMTLGYHRWLDFCAWFFGDLGKALWWALVPGRIPPQPVTENHSA